MKWDKRARGVDSFGTLTVNCCLLPGGNARTPTEGAGRPPADRAAEGRGSHPDEAAIHP